MTEIEGFDIGDKVKHPKFGTGTIVFRTGEGDKQKVTIKFGSDVGEKKLLVGLAKLKLISERVTLAPEAAVEAVPGRAQLGKQEDIDDDDEEVEEIIEDDDDEEVIEDEADDEEEAVTPKKKPAKAKAKKADDDDDEILDDDDIIEDEDEDDDDDIEDEDDE